MAGFGISMRNSSDEGLTQTARDESRQTGDGDNVEQFTRTLSGIHGIHAASLQPPKLL